MKHMKHMMFRFALWLPPGRGEEKPLQGTMAQRLTSAELPRRTASRQTRKRLRKTTVLRSLCFCCKKQWITTAGCVSVATHGCMATVGCVRLQPIDALQLPVVFPLQPWDALQPWVVFGTFGKEKKGWSNHPFSFSTSVFAPANAVMCARVHPATQPPDAPRRAVSPGRTPPPFPGAGCPCSFQWG